MSIENLVYNCGGIDYWELIYQDDDNRLCLYEGHHGQYVGEVIDNQVYNTKTGEYLGEFYEGRLIVDKSKIGKEKIKSNFMFLGFGRMGHACIPKKPPIAIPQGYMEFTVGLS